MKLSLEGQTHLNDALAKLQSFGSYGNLLYFGFGAKHIVRTLADSAEGMSTVALCACIAEAHSPNLATQIVQEYANLYSTQASDSNLTPSFRQWQALISSCSGTLATSPFGSIIEFFMSFRDHEHRCGDPKQVAFALQGLAKISSGLMKSMVLVGNSECGFLAAIAHWFLSLRVAVQNSSGNIVYPSIDADPDDYQVLIVYSDSSNTSESIKQRSEVYYIDNIKELFDDIRGSDYLSGKVEWDTAFTQTFGSSAKKLIQTPSLLGQIVGSAAKIYSIPQQSLPLPPGQAPHRPTRFGIEGSGGAFVDLACRRLPELRSARDVMDAAVERSGEEACLHFTKTMAILMNICGCSSHCDPRYINRVAHLDSHLEPNRSSTDVSFGSRCCLRSLVLTIIQLVRQISTIGSIPNDLCPRRRGLETLNKNVGQSLAGFREHPFDVALLYYLEPIGSLDLAKIIFGVEASIAETEKYHEFDLNKPSIFVNGGLCFIRGSVVKMSCRPEDALQVHIIPGQIEWKQKTYTTIRDGRNISAHSFIPPVILPTSEARYKHQMQLIRSMEVRAVVMESSECLRFSYEIKSESGECYLGPVKLSDSMLVIVNNGICQGSSCRVFSGFDEAFWFTLYNRKVPFEANGHRQNTPNMENKSNIVLIGDSDLALCSVIAGIGSDLPGSRYILQDRECIACCAERAMMYEEPHRTLIISRLTVEDLENVLKKPGSLLLGHTGE